MELSKRKEKDISRNYKSEGTWAIAEAGVNMIGVAPVRKRHYLTRISGACLIAANNKCLDFGWPSLLINVPLLLSTCGMFLSISHSRQNQQNILLQILPNGIISLHHWFFRDIPPFSEEKGLSWRTIYLHMSVFSFMKEDNNCIYVTELLQWLEDSIYVNSFKVLRRVLGIQ